MSLQPVLLRALLPPGRFPHTYCFSNIVQCISRTAEHALLFSLVKSCQINPCQVLLSPGKSCFCMLTVDGDLSGWHSRATPPRPPPEAPPQDTVQSASRQSHCSSQAQGQQRRTSDRQLAGSLHPAGGLRHSLPDTSQCQFKYCGGRDIVQVTASFAAHAHRCQGRTERRAGDSTGCTDREVDSFRDPSAAAGAAYSKPGLGNLLDR